MKILLTYPLTGPQSPDTIKPSQPLTGIQSPDTIKPSQPLTGIQSPDTIPQFTLLADSALMADRRQPLFLPSWSQNWQIQLALAFRISRQGRNISAKFASRYYNAMTVMAILSPGGISQIQGPSLIADETLRMGEWIEIPADNAAPTLITASLAPIAQDGEISPLIVKAEVPISLIDSVITSISKVASLKTGDIIITQPQGIAPPGFTNITENHILTAYINSIENLKIKIK